MKILIITPLSPPQTGGPATVTVLLSEFFGGLGHTIQVVSFKDCLQYPFLVRHFVFFLKVFSAAKGKDKVYLLDTVSAGLPAICALRLRSMPYTLRVPGDYAWETYVSRTENNVGSDEFWSRSQGLLYEALKLLQKFAIDHASGVIVQSQFQKQLLQKWGASPSKLYVIPNAISLPFSVVKPKPYSVIVVGRLHPIKGLEAVIRAMVRVSIRFPELRVAFYGDGPQLSELKDLAYTLGASEYISFKGSKSHEETLQAMAESEVYILNTKQEMFSNTLLESFALGMKVVATNGGGNAEMVDGNAIVVPFNDEAAIADAVIQLFTDHKFAAELAAHAKESVKKYSTENILPVWKQTLEK
ncbi:MAG TPA: glycosyltransferase family 4 protein [Patescibacteria group bacterium]|nr:glycosyltransferase family 4 protein [Patescibacteria group bacterium]